jgi:CRP-like cAMP-binding protein
MHPSFKFFFNWLQNNNLVPTKEDMEMLYDQTEHFIVPKGEMILEQNRPTNYFYYLNEGIVRLFLRHNNEDITIAFVQAPQFACTTMHLLSRQLSPLALETCTQIEGIRWSREQFITLKEETQIGNKIEAAFTNTLLTWNLEREIERLTLPPEMRYQKLLEDAPLVLRYVPLKHIASYLGIHQDSLSRIRNRIVKRI